MSMAFLTGMPGPLEILLILFVILLLFGAKKLPELSRSLGKSLSAFKKGKLEGEKSLDELSEGSSEEESVEKLDEPKGEKTEEEEVEIKDDKEQKAD